MADVVTWNDSEANLQKEPKTYCDFVYDTQTDGGCLTKFDEIDALIGTINEDVTGIADKYSELQDLYQTFTDYDETMNTNKQKLQESANAIKDAYNQVMSGMQQQVEELQKNDETLMEDLDSINELLAQDSSDDLAAMADDVIAGKYGTGDERRAALGDNYEAVQDIVNKKLKGEWKEGDTPTTETPTPTTDIPTPETPTTDTPVAETPAPETPSTEAGFVPSGADDHPATGTGPVLNSHLGTIEGPSGKETYYNLNMNKIVNESQPGGWVYNDAAAHGNEGNLSNNIWVRDDGCKMMGDYIMVAANLDVHPRGSIVQTSLGPGVVVDTGDFAKTNPTQIDVATTW